MTQCFFCNKQTIDTTLGAADAIATCRCDSCDVTYILQKQTGLLETGFFDTKLIHSSGKPYTVWLFFNSNKTKVSVILHYDWEEDEILELEGFPLTPQNIETKLPLYLPFI